MQHDRRLARVVFIDEFGAQTPRHREIDLNGAALPDAANRVLERKFDLGAVKRALARQGFPRHALRIQSIRQRLFGDVPGLIGANPLGRPRRQLVNNVVKTEVAINVDQQVDEIRDLGLNLRLGAENMTVVLRETAHAHDAVQGARRFIAMAGAELAVA